jgi:hypothetical protein
MNSLSSLNVRMVIVSFHKSTSKDKSLGDWVHSQRKSHSKNKLRLDRKVLLDDIGFVWKVGKSARAPWNKHYEELVEFNRKNGHCLVPQKYQQDASLGKWVSNQRRRHAKLRLDRKVLLDELGFVWRVKRPRTCLAESEQIAARTNPRGGAIGSRSYVEKDGGRDDEDSKPSLVTSSSALVASYPDQEVVREEAHHNTIPSGWNVSWKVG